MVSELEWPESNICQILTNVVIGEEGGPNGGGGESINKIFVFFLFTDRPIK